VCCASAGADRPECGICATVKKCLRSTARFGESSRSAFSLSTAEPCSLFVSLVDIYIDVIPLGLPAQSLADP
jgi:hypothetical protein